jgi:hypothetical protein
MNDSNAIDNMVAALSNAGADLTSPVKQGHAGVIYNSVDDSFQQMTAAPPTNGLTAQSIPDDGRDIAAAHAAIISNVDALQSRLDAVTFDKTTGSQTYTVTGDQREKLQLQVEQARRSGAYDIERLQALHAQRSRVSGQIATVDGQRSLEAEAARMAFIDGAPRGLRAQYAADYDRMMQEARTREVTAAVAAATRRR